MVAAIAAVNILLLHPPLRGSYLTKPQRFKAARPQAPPTTLTPSYPIPHSDPPLAVPLVHGVDPDGNLANPRSSVEGEKDGVALDVGGDTWTGPMPPAAQKVRRYNVAWDTPSHGATGSMPVGNGDVAANVWIQEDGALHFLVSKADAFDENHQLLKLGLVTITFDPPLHPMGPGFNQTLDLMTGTVVIQLGTKAMVRVWVDAHTHTINTRFQSFTGMAHSVTVRLTNWRNHSAPLFPNWKRAYCEDRSIIPDVVVQAQTLAGLKDHVTWYHRNSNASLLANLLHHQRLEHLRSEFHDDVLQGWTFGGSVHGPGLVRTAPHTLHSATAAASHTISTTVHAQRSRSATD